jgi:hypothetical protein
MEAWATVALVLGSNAIMGVVNWLTTRMQVKNSANELEKRLQAQRQEYKHRQRWDSRRDPLIRLREELASMADKLERLVYLATEVIEGVVPDLDRKTKELEKVGKNWEAYVDSGAFNRALHMQYDSELKGEARAISGDYEAAFVDVMAYWRGGQADAKIREAQDVIRNNAVKIVAVQSKTNRLLDEL